MFSLHTNIDATSLSKQVWYDREQLSRLTHFASGSVALAWPVSASTMCCEALCTSCSWVHLDLQNHHVFAHYPTILTNLERSDSAMAPIQHE